MDLILLGAKTHRRTAYNARAFDEQQGYRYTFSIRGGELFVETGAYIHWKAGQLVDLAFDLSCMSGCSYGCKFCAASQYNRGFLTSDEIVDQFTATLEQVSIEAGPVVSECPIITVSFEGMGEPSLPESSRSMASAVQVLQNRFVGKRPIQFLVSTIGARPKALVEWADELMPLETLQVSLHASSDQKRQFLVGRPIPSIADVFEGVRYFRKKRPEVLVKINYLLMTWEDDTNYSEEDLDRLADLLGESGAGYYLKLSYLNQTTPSIANGIRGATEAEAQACLQHIEARFENVYLYGTTSELDISCGQLASYAEATVAEPRIEP